MVIFHSFVGLPEGTPIPTYPPKETTSPLSSPTGGRELLGPWGRSQGVQLGIDLWGSPFRKGDIFWEGMIGGGDVIRVSYLYVYTIYTHTYIYICIYIYIFIYLFIDSLCINQLVDSFVYSFVSIPLFIYRLSFARSRTQYT